MPQIVYDRDGITLYHGDCIDLLPTLVPVHHVITDPPYEAEAHTLQRRQHGAGGARRYAGISAKPLTFDAIDAAMRAAVAKDCGRLVRRWVLTFCQIEASQTWRVAYEAAGLCYRRTCIWVKPDGLPQLSGDRPGMGYETFVAMHAAGASRWNGGGRRGVFTHQRVPAGTVDHPTAKPLALMLELVRLFTDPGETILDPFAGSGTTLLAARALGRRAIGIERDAHYCDVAVQRLAEPLFDQTDASPFTQLGLELPA